MILTVRFLPLANDEGYHPMGAFDAFGKRVPLGGTDVLHVPDRHPHTIITALAHAGYRPVGALADPYELLRSGDPYAADYSIPVESEVPGMTPAGSGTIALQETSEGLLLRIGGSNGVMIAATVSDNNAAALYAHLGDWLDKRAAASAEQRARDIAEAERVAALPTLRARFLSVAATGDHRIGLSDANTGRTVFHADDQPFLTATHHGYFAALSALVEAGYDPLERLTEEQARRTDPDSMSFDILVKRVR
jgi:hypothetical protein